MTESLTATRWDSDPQNVLALARWLDVVGMFDYAGEAIDFFSAPSRYDTEWAISQLCGGETDVTLYAVCPQCGRRCELTETEACIELTIDRPRTWCEECLESFRITIDDVKREKPCK